MKSLISLLSESLLAFIYPPHCMHCDDILEKTTHILCPLCLSQLDVLDPKIHCPRCFSERGDKPMKHCSNCKSKTFHMNYQASVFEYTGPAASLIKKMKYHQKPFLASSIAAFMVTQWVQLQWPIPDAIVPTPISFTHKFERGYNQCEFIANEMSKLMSIPIWNVLQRRSGDFSQAGLNLSQREELKGDNFYLTKNHNLKDKSLLLIDDVMTTGTTLNQCSQKLLEGYPKEIRALTFCKTVI